MNPLLLLGCAGAACLPRPSVRPGAPLDPVEVEAWLARRDEALPDLAVRVAVTGAGLGGHSVPLRVEADGDRVRLELDDGEPPSLVLVSVGGDSVLVDRAHQRFRSGRCERPLAALLPEPLASLTPRELARLLVGGATLACEGGAASPPQPAAGEVLRKAGAAEVRWDSAAGADVVARCGRRVGVREGPGGHEVAFFEDGARALPYRATYRNLATVALIGVPWRLPQLVLVEAGTQATDRLELAITARTLDTPIPPERLALPARPVDYTAETWRCAAP